MEKWPASFTYDPDHRLYYFAPDCRAKAPYRKQIEVRAIIDIADDGTLAGVELIDNMPEMYAPPPANPSRHLTPEAIAERRERICNLFKRPDINRVLHQYDDDVKKGKPK